MGNLIVEAGQYWKENRSDINGVRIVQVIEVREEMVRIRTVLLRIGSLSSKGYVTWTSKERFNNKSNGYTYLPVKAI